MLLTRNEARYLQTLLMSEYKIKSERMLHAASHGSDFYDPDMKFCENILAKIEIEIMEGRTNDKESISNG